MLRLAVVTALVSAASSVAAAPALAAPGVELTISGSAAVSGTVNPYRLMLEVNNFGYPTRLTLTLERTSTTGNHAAQQDIFEFPAANVDCTASLSGCTATDSDGMGTYGRLSMTFSPTKTAKVTDIVCYGVTIGTRTRRKGELSGTLRLKTGTAYFGTVRNGGAGAHTPETLPVVAVRDAYNGNDCGPFTPPPCAHETTMAIFSSPYIRASRPADVATASLLVGWGESPGGDVYVLHEISGLVPHKNVKVTSNSPSPLERNRLNFDSLAPFAGGIATLNATSAPSAPDSCGAISRNVDMSGTVTGHFDGYGTMTMTDGSGNVLRSP